jgi:hypothetical protein
MVGVPILVTQPRQRIMEELRRAKGHRLPHTVMPQQGRQHLLKTAPLHPLPAENRNRRQRAGLAPDRGDQHALVGPDPVSFTQKAALPGMVLLLKPSASRLPVGGVLNALVRQSAAAARDMDALSHTYRTAFTI